MSEGIIIGEDNTEVWTWSESVQHEKGDSLPIGSVSTLNGYVRMSTNQSPCLSEVQEVWEQWSDDMKDQFKKEFGDIALLVKVPIDRHLMRAMAQFWNPAYNCFTFGKIDMTPTLEEYKVLINCPTIKSDRIYIKPNTTSGFKKK